MRFLLIAILVVIASTGISYGEETNQINNHWLNTQADIKQRFDPSEYRQWIEPLIPDQDDGHTLVLAASSHFHADWVRTTFSDRLARVTGRRIKVICTGSAQARAGEGRGE